jgi:hypothetical protein
MGHANAENKGVRWPCSAIFARKIKNCATLWQLIAVIGVSEPPIEKPPGTRLTHEKLQPTNRKLYFQRSTVRQNRPMRIIPYVVKYTTNVKFDLEAVQLLSDVSSSVILKAG